MTFSTDSFSVIEGELRLSPEVTALPDGAFSGRTDIRRAALPPGLRRFGEEVFSGCTALEEVVLPAHMGELGAGAFVSCEALERVVLPPELTVIGPGAFLFCQSLRSLALPPSLREVGELAFSGAGLEEILLPPSVSYVGDSAFWDCPALGRAEVPNPLCRLDVNVFGSCDALTEGYIAPGYPAVTDSPAELVYTLLWCSCPERHGEAVCRRAEDFIRKNEPLVMDWVLRQNNRAALSGLLRRGLLERGALEGYVRRTLANGQTELTALLLAAGQGERKEEDWTL